MNINHGIQVYAPGQVWRIRLDRDEKSITDNKYRPYLILGSVKRRLIMLKMTHGGSFSSNWIYPIENLGNGTSNIILDAPIVVGTEKINESDCEYMYTLSRDLFIDIYQHYMASMLYISALEREILSDGSIERIKTILDEHIDNMYAFSRYGLISKSVNNVAISDNTDDTDLVSVPDMSENATIEEINSSEEDNSDDDADNDSDSDDDISDEESEDESDEDLSETQHSGRTRYAAKKDHVDIEDLVIFGEGFTKLEDVNIAATEFDIKNAKFQLSDLCIRKKCVYINGKYNFTLKKMYKTSTPNKRSLRKYRTLIRSDINTFGASMASKMWGLSISTIYYYAKNNRRDCV